MEYFLLELRIYVEQISFGKKEKIEIRQSFNWELAPCLGIGIREIYVPEESAVITSRKYQISSRTSLHIGGLSPLQEINSIQWISL